MILTSGKFWGPVVWSCIVSLLLAAIAMFNALEGSLGGGGSDSFFIILYPVPILVNAPGLSTVLVLTQFVFYGVVVGIGRYKGKGERYIAVLAVVHVIGCIVAFLARE